jgi:glycosyltransferase involved in cell wall biosynthesis
MNSPKVSIVCVCYNHKPYVREAMESALHQNHGPLEVIVVDDGSSDGSPAVIGEFVKHYPDVQFIPLSKNGGYCRAFNEGFRRVTGEFVIDLAADDVLMSDRVSKGLRAFSQHGPEYGVNFSDAELMDADGITTGFHSDRFPHETIPQGDVYVELIRRYFINSPTMMIRREVLDKMGGYDESLAYEDFDFWIRSSRDFRYCYTPEPLVRKRILPDSMAAKQHGFTSRQMTATLKVCEKIRPLNRNSAEREAYRKRIFYELRRSLQVGRIGLAINYFYLLI